MAKSFACAAALCILFFTQAAAGRGQQSAGPMPAAAPPLKIDSGDLIEVTMFENPDLSGRFRVDEKGEVTVPLIGRVHVKGATAEEVAATIEKRFVEAQILQPAESHATVFIAEYATQGITVNGEVKTPGVYPALGVRMLNDVIASAGGATPCCLEGGDYPPQRSWESGHVGVQSGSPQASDSGRADFPRRLHPGSQGRHCLRAGRCESRRRLCTGWAQLSDRGGGNGACRG